MGYRERLTVPGWWHLAAAGIGVLFGGEAVLSTDPVIAGPVVAGFVLLAEAVLWSAGRRQVLVAGGTVVAGSARLPVSEVRAVARLGPEAMRAEMRRPDPLVFRCTAGWVRTGVLLEVAGRPAAGRWLVSTRRPEALARALAEAAGPAAGR